MVRFITLLFFTLLMTALYQGCEAPNNPQSATPEFDPAPWLEKGQAIQKEVFGALSGQLAAAMAEGGVQGAAAYCQLTAYPLTDSLARIHQALIRRATLQPRNPANRASAEETAVLAAYRQDLLAGREPAPRAVKTGDGIAYYSPIRIQALCLNCHGTVGAELRTEDHAFLKSLYPDDQATGYALGDLRGIWHIRFRDENVLRPM